MMRLTSKQKKLAGAITPSEQEAEFTNSASQFFNRMISQQSTNKRTEDSAARLIVNRFNLHNYGDLRSCSASQAAMGDEDGSNVISPRFPN